MDIFEKQQRIETINGIIKVRWFIAAIIIGLGVILKAKYFGWAGGFEGSLVYGYLKMGAFGAVAFGYNFIFWLFMRRLVRKPIEKISGRALNNMSTLQIVPDLLMFTLIFYNTGTVDTMSFMYYFLSIFFASSIYKSRGIILTGALAGFLYTTLLIIESQGLIPHLNTYQGITLFGSPYVTRGRIVSFIFYIGITTFTAAFLSNLIRSREKKLRQQHGQLSSQTQLLTHQTQELTQAKDEIQGALVISDVAKRAATQSRDEAEKANLELKKKVDELEKFYKITVGREVRMVELKSQIKDLRQTIKNLEGEISKK